MPNGLNDGIFKAREGDSEEPRRMNSVAISPKSSFSFEQRSVEEFEIDEDLDDDPTDLNHFGPGKAVYFENKRVIIENKNIFQNNKLKFQFVSSMLSLFFLGLVDQVVGSLIEYFLAEYHIDRVQLSYLFVSQFCGYIPASILNNYLMKRYGLHKLYVSACFIVCCTSTLFFLKVPFAILPICSVFVGWSNGTFDCCLNYFVGNLDYSNELLGLMHSMYGLGCLVTPVLSIHLIKLGMPWNYYFLLLIATAFVNLIFAYFFFKHETATKYRYIASLERKNNSENSEFNNAEDNEIAPSIQETICNKYVIFYSLALFTYVGSELSVGVWLNNYMYRIKHQTEEKSSIITSTFWLFMTGGRAFMGFFTGRYYQDREIKCIVVYCFIVAISCLCFWIFQFSITLQVISICVAAWFVGPLFSTTIIIALKTLPKRYALHSISLIAGFGGAGAAIIPSILGYISEHFGKSVTGDSNGAGLKYFPECVFITFLLAAMLWLAFYLKHKSVFDAQVRLK